MTLMKCAAIPKIDPPSNIQSGGVIPFEIAMDEGEELSVVLRNFLRDVDRATDLVGHNIEFDMNIIGAELHRLNVTHSMLSKKQICTMKASTNTASCLGTTATSGRP